MNDDDQRRRVPGTDTLLALPAVIRARERLSDAAVRAIISAAQSAARDGDLAVDDVERAVEEAVRERLPLTLRPVLNATGVVVHTNLGRAPLSAAARAALEAASGYVAGDLDLEHGCLSARGPAYSARR